MKPYKGHLKKCVFRPCVNIAQAHLLTTGCVAVKRSNFEQEIHYKQITKI